MQVRKPIISLYGSVPAFWIPETFGEDIGLPRIQIWYSIRFLIYHALEDQGIQQVWFHCEVIFFRMDTSTYDIFIYIYIYIHIHNVELPKLQILGPTNLHQSVTQKKMQLRCLSGFQVAKKVSPPKQPKIKPTLTTQRTVDGRNPAPPGMYKTL